MDLAKYGGRRFILTLGCGVATSVLCWAGKIDGATYAAVTIATVGAFIAGDTTQRIKTAGKAEGPAE